MQKRLGDGFYEQRLVNEQVAQLTGQRFLAGYSNEEAQYKALMDAGTTFAQQYQLRPGIALTDAAGNFNKDAARLQCNSALE